MKNKPYALLLKTGDAELRAMENFAIDHKNIFPIIELTRGRKSKNEKIGLIKKRLDKIKKIFRGQNICLDLTTSSTLSNTEIDDLYFYENGYQNWINFLTSVQNENVFKEITPTILVNIEDPNFNKNIRSQVISLISSFSSISYRNSLADDACYNDINLVKDIINKNKSTFYFIIDCEYIAPGAWKSFAEKAKVRIEKIKSLINTTQFIIVSTSFPNNVSEIGKDDEDAFRLNEIDLYNDISEHFSSLKIIYGDYASINPIRNDEVIMSRGWVPRIDVSLPNEIFYIRERRGVRDYSSTYTSIAKKLRLNPKFPNYLSSNWGVQQIINSSTGTSPGSNPSFWISVRMNIHIEQQLRRLSS